MFEGADVESADHLTTYTGGKTVEDAGADCLSLLQELQFEHQDGNSPLSHEPQPLLYPTGTIDVNAADSDDDDDGFWDWRPDWYERRSRARNLTLFPDAFNDYARGIGHREEAVDIDNTGGRLSAGILHALPGFFFSFDYLKNLACTSSAMKRAVQDRQHWHEKCISVKSVEFADGLKLGHMTRAYMSAHAMSLDVRQLAQLPQFPSNMLLDWTGIQIHVGDRKTQRVPLHPKMQPQ